MADVKKETDGPTPYSPAAFDFSQLPDGDVDFVSEADFAEFIKALAAPEHSPSTDDLTTLQHEPQKISSQNDWMPIHQKVRKRNKSKKQPRRGKDETREGFVYTLLKWPLLLLVFGWLLFLGIAYMLTRVYIYLYEHWITWRGKRQRLRKQLQSATSYEEWIKGAKELDTYLGNDEWKESDEYAYYDSKTLRRVRDQLVKLRRKAEDDEHTSVNGKEPSEQQRAAEELRGLLEACVKGNFVGFENPRLYSETYYGTKNLVQSFIDEVATSIEFLMRTTQLDQESKRAMFRHIGTNYGRTALCLSGGATFAYYHFGVAKALMDADLLPEVITGTSGGALVAALLGTRTDEELKRVLVPALAHRITACHDDMLTWMKRWYQTGARFDSVDWAKRCAWFTRGSMTFKEAYQRTGRILNVSCVPSDPHSPTILANYLTAPDCVIWSAVLASAAVPGILNPVVLMKKAKDGTLVPYSFGHKWKDGSLRTDIPLKALNLHFNCRFSIVSQVNPHINLFFFSSRGSVGRPVTHRRGRGWRGGFLGSAIEQYIKLDLTKWLKVLRHLELLPRPLGQDWSEIWLQRFSGTITIWPKSIISDFYYILSDPTPQRLARMIHAGMHSAYPKLTFIANRTKLERLIHQGRRQFRPVRGANDTGFANILSEDDLSSILKRKEGSGGDEQNPLQPYPFSASDSSSSDEGPEAKTPGFSFSRKGSKQLPPRLATKSGDGTHEPGSPSLSQRFSGWWSSSNALRPRPTPEHTNSHPRPPHSAPFFHDRPNSMFELGSSSGETTGLLGQRGKPSFLNEVRHRSRVFEGSDEEEDDDDDDDEEHEVRAREDGHGDGIELGKDVGAGAVDDADMFGDDEGDGGGVAETGV